MLTCKPASDPESSPDAMASRRMLLGSGLALLAGASLLAGCGSAPRKTRTSQRRRSGPAGTAPLRTSTPEVAVSNPVQIDATLREEAVARALLAVNVPYSYGGNTLEGGFDCSGLVQYVFSGFAGRALPRSTAQWARASLPRDIGLLQRGDLVFFNTSGTSFSHMGIYLGNRQFVHAPSSGGVVRTDRIDNSYFAPRFDGGRTVFL